MSHAVDYKQESCALAESLEANSNTEWLAAFRQSSLAALQRLSFPTRKTEHYKYNNLMALQKQSFSSLVQGGNQEVVLPALASSEDTQRLVFIDGAYSQTHSQISDYQLTAFSETNVEQRTLILNYLDKDTTQKSFFQLVNDSLTQDGLLIETTSEQSHKPLHLVYVTTAAGQQKTGVSNLLVHLKTRSEATLVEHFISDSSVEETAVANHSVHYVLDDHAKLAHYRMHLEKADQIHFGHVAFWLQKHSDLKSFHVGLGGELKRVDVNVYHQASGSNADIQGIYLSTDRQQIDYHTNVQHQAPHCTTQEVFRGIVGGQSKAVFNGRIHIFPDAQKTLAQLSNKNLLLSKQAEVNTKPELEIYADDVQCAHGATVSQMDEASLFYLQSRGIPKDQAKLILSFGFINELINNIEYAEVAEYLRPILTDFFEQVT